MWYGLGPVLRFLRLGKGLPIKAAGIYAEVADCDGRMGAAAIYVGTYLCHVRN